MPDTEHCAAEGPLLPRQPWRHDPRLVASALRAWCDQQPTGSIRRRAIEAMLRESAKSAQK